jgi:hypothetical protein
METCVNGVETTRAVVRYSAQAIRVTFRLFALVSPVVTTRAQTVAAWHRKLTSVTVQFATQGP